MTPIQKGATIKKKPKEEIAMKLTLEEIKTITAGAVRIFEKDGAFRFHKCTEKQVDAWYKESDTLGYRAEATTGIRLDFYTNSDNIAFYVKRGGKYEVKIDGLITHQYLEGESERNYRVSLVIPQKPMGQRKRVTVVFPSHSIGIISSLELDDGAYFEPVNTAKKLLFIGDSITQGCASFYDSLSYAYRVTDYFDADSVINGIGGAYYLTGSFDTPDFDPDAVFLAYGTNDYFHYRDEEKRDRMAREYLDLIKEAYGKKKVFVISPIWRANDKCEVLGENFHAFRLYIEKLARERGFFVIDGLSLVPPQPRMYNDKYLHPNDLGFSLYAENLIKQVKDLI